MRFDTPNGYKLRLDANGGTARPAIARGPAGADGSNVLPTDAAIAAAIDNPASDTAASLSASIEQAVLMLPASTGVDDTDLINDFLTACASLDADHVVVRGRPGEKYTTDGSIVMHSGQTLDVQLVHPDGANCPTIRNYSHVNPSRTTTCTTAVGNPVVALTGASAADVGRTLVIAGAGPGGSVHTGTVLSRSSGNVTLDAAPFTVVTGGSVTVYNRDHDIYLGGSYDCGDTDGATDGPLRHHILLRHVDRYGFLAGFRMTSTGGKFGIAPGGCTGGRFPDDMHFEVSSAAIQFDGPVKDTYVGAVSGYSDLDDFLAAGTNGGTDAYTQYQDTAGAIENLTINRPNCTGSPTVMCRIFSGDGNTAMVSTSLTAGYQVKNLVLRDFQGSGISGSPALVLASYKNGGGFINPLIDGVADGLRSTDGAMIQLSCNADVVRISRLVSRLSTTAIYQESGSVGLLEVDGLEHYGSTADNDHCLAVNGTITEARFRNFKSVHQSPGYFAKILSSGSMPLLKLIDGTETDGGGLLDTGSNSKNCDLVVRGVKMTGAYWTVGYLGGATTLNISEFACASHGGGGAFNVTASGDVIVTGGAGVTYAGHPVVDGGGTLRIKAAGFPVNLGYVTETEVGDVCFNDTDNAGGSGIQVGLCVCNGTAWKNVYTGTTYTP